MIRKSSGEVDPLNIAKLMGELRQRTYCNLLSNNKEEKGAKIIRCTFDRNCGRNIKGKGNLRRHIEWHLRRVEEDCRNRFARLEDNFEESPLRLYEKALQELEKNFPVKLPKDMTVQFHFQPFYTAA